MDDQTNTNADFVLAAQDGEEEKDKTGTEEVTEELSVTKTEEPSSQEAELETLRAEVKSLKELLAKREQEQESALRELEEFNRLFPEIAIKQIPDEVWEDMQKGIPLCAAYALYEKKSRMAEVHAFQINQRNASLSAGKAGLNTSGEYFTPDEVRAMSQRQVRENYKKIIESMKSWG